jgi:hypothetical protein
MGERTMGSRRLDANWVCFGVENFSTPDDTGRVLLRALQSLTPAWSGYTSAGATESEMPVGRRKPARRLSARNPKLVSNVS